MCVLYVSFWSKVRDKSLGCVAMGSAVLFILRSRMLLHSAVNRMQVVLSGFIVRLFCFVQATTLCRYGCMYFFTALVFVCVDVMVMSSAYAITWTGALGGGMSTVYILKVLVNGRRFGMGTMLANFHMCGIMLVLRAVFIMLVRSANPIGPMCFRCLVIFYVLLC